MCSDSLNMIGNPQFIISAKFSKLHKVIHHAEFIQSQDKGKRKERKKNLHQHASKRDQPSKSQPQPGNT